MESLFEPLKTLFSQQPKETTFWVAFSGGLDSHVLLHVCAALQKNVKAIHINHGLSANAVSWEKHCYFICHDLNVPMMSQSLQMPRLKGQSVEAYAREQRYLLFANLLKEGDCLLTAHHQDDQAETILLQLIRGAGIKGLASMPSIKSLGKGFHYRPFLHITREDLEKYAKEHQLQWIEDESNENSHFDRNFLRHNVLPMLKKRWPSVTKTLARSAKHCAEAELLLAGEGGGDNQLSIKKLLLLPHLKQRYLLRAWLDSLHFPPPSEAKLQQIIQTVIPAAKDRFPLVTWGEYEVRRYQETLFALPKRANFDQSIVLKWDFKKPLLLPDGRMIRALLTKRENLFNIESSCEVRFRQGGEKCRLSESHRHSLKNLFQAWGVPPWERNRVPLIFINDELAAVVGYFYDKRYITKKDELGVELILT